MNPTSQQDLLAPVYQEQYRDMTRFGVDRVSSFLSVIHCVRTLEFCLERETAENHKTNIH